MEECGRCSKGPDGLEGHFELTFCLEEQPRYGAAAGHHLFRCVECSARWLRFYDGGGIFRWTRGES